MAKGNSIGKILEIEPGYKPSWTGAHGTFYPFRLKIQAEAGGELEGEANSKQETPKYKVGDQIHYDFAKGKFTGLEVVKEGYGGSKGEYKSSYSDPKVILNMSFSMNQNNALILYTALGAEPKDIQSFGATTNKFHQWCIGITPMDRDAVLRRAYCIERAIGMLQFKTIYPNLENPQKKSTDQIMEIAEILYAQQSEASNAVS